MTRKAILSLIAAALLLSSQGVALAQALKLEDVTDNLTRDPHEALFVVEDVERFIRVAQLLRSDTDTLAVLQREYLDSGTPGLTMFIEKYNLTAERLRRAMRRHPEKYASLDGMPDAIRAMEAESRRAFVRMKEVIPQVVYLPTYYLVGAYRGIGSGSVEGPLITVEKWSIPIENETTMLIHEMTHLQQVVAVGYDKYKALFGEEKSLLGLCIREGTAEFVARLVTGSITQEGAEEFTRAHEKRLWERFVEEMHGSETGDWMWSKPEDPEQPPHAGYVLGERIVAAYYENAADKSQAINDILGVTDYAAFLEQSGYTKRFRE